MLDFWTDNFLEPCFSNPQLSGPQLQHILFNAHRACHLQNFDGLKTEEDDCLH